MEFILSKLGLIGPFFLLLGVLIFVHEWGHFIVARLCGVRVETFSIGFGPKIFSKKWGDTQYALGVIPLGGYVKMYGDGVDEAIPENEKNASFNHQSVLERIAIVAAGPLLNLIFAFFLFFLLGFFGTPEIGTYVGDVDKNSAAFSAGLREDDLITSLEGQKVYFYEDLSKIISKRQNGSNVRIEVLRDNKKLNFVVPIEVQKNTSPIAWEKKIGSIKGINPMRTSSLVGVDYQSQLAQKGAPALAKITRINDIKVESLSDLNAALEKVATEKLNIQIEKNKGESLSFEIEKPDAAKWTFTKAGFAKPELFIEQVRRGSPAEKAGLLKGDQVLSINSQPLNTWSELVEGVKITPLGKEVSLKIGRNGEALDLRMEPLRTEIITSSGQVEYRPTIGVMPSLEYLPPKTVARKIRNPIKTLQYAGFKTYQWTALTLRGFKKLLTGEVSHKTLSGVISIGKVAKDSLRVGWAYFIQMMAIISINLFLLNLLPVPVLDGGHLLFYFAELVKGSPVSLKTRLIGQQIGLVLILSLVFYTLFNDFSRIVFSGW